MQNVNRLFVSDDGKSYVWLHKRITISVHQVWYLLLNKNDQDADIYRKVLQECMNPQNAWLLWIKRRPLLTLISCNVCQNSNCMIHYFQFTF